MAVTHLVRTFGPPQWVPLDKQSPSNLVPMDKWSPSNLVSLDKWSLEYSICPGGQAVGIRKYGDRIGWGPFVQEDQFYGDRLSRGTGSGDQGIKWVWDQMRRSRLL